MANPTRSLDVKTIRPQAPAIMHQIIHSVTIYPSDQPEAEVAAKLGRFDLLPRFRSTLKVSFP